MPIPSSFFILEALSNKAKEALSSDFKILVN